MVKVIPDIVEDFINSLSYESRITGIIGAGPNYTYQVENLFNLRPKMTAYIDGIQFIVDSVNHDLGQFVVLLGPSTGDKFNIAPPFFFHGTFYATNSHISRLSDAQKVPMIYLHEIIREKIPALGDRPEIISDFRLYFLDVANYQDWNTDQHYENVIIPMRNLVNYFIEKVRKPNRFLTNSDEIELVNHVKFGQFSDLKGHIQSLFNDRLSGIELKTVFSIKNCIC